MFHGDFHNRHHSHDSNCPRRSSFAHLTKELLRRYIEWILLKDAANDDDRMRPHDVDHRVTAESAQVVRANYRIVVTIPQIVDARLEFNELVDVRSTLCPPVHSADDATERKPVVRVTAGELLEYLQHPMLIEAAVAKVRVRVRPNLELTRSLSGGGIDADRRQALQMIFMLVRVDDVNRFVAAREAVLDERQQHPIFLIVAVEKRADMACVAELRAGERNGCDAAMLHGALLPRVARIDRMRTG